MKTPKLHVIAGQPSWSIRSSTVEAAVTQTGGHVAPVVFDRKARRLQPYSIAPWAAEDRPILQPQIIRVLRGDFFCLPFGGNDAPYRGERHPVHGETANRDWRFVSLAGGGGEHLLRLRMKTTLRPGTVDKTLRLVDGHNAVYCRHTLTGFSGPMNPGHHAILRFPDEEGSGLISTSRFVHGQVYVQPTERPDQRGYSCLKPGAVFTSMRKVPTVFGGTADLSRYPARRGFEDIAILVADPSLDVAWVAASFPRQRYVWFALHDPRTLASTLLWMSNGGRHYPPWSGRHVNVIGLEQMTGFFHEGLNSSARPNSLSRRGLTTCLTLSPSKPTTVNYIMACIPTPAGFSRVRSLTPSRDKTAVTLTDDNGRKLTAPLDVAWLTGK